MIVAPSMLESLKWMLEIKHQSPKPKGASRKRKAVRTNRHSPAAVGTMPVWEWGRLGQFRSSIIANNSISPGAFGPRCAYPNAMRYDATIPRASTSQKF